MSKRFKAGDLIGHRKDGRPIHLIGGGAPVDGEQDTDDSGDADTTTDDGGQDQSQNDGDTSQDDDLLAGDDGQQNDAGDDDDGGGQQLSPDDIRRLVSEEANRIADRRINQALQTRQRRQQQSSGDRQQQQGSTQQQATSSADVREARLVYREYVADQVKFTSTEERNIGANLARSIVTSALASGVDVETAGQQAAQQVADQVKALRATHQRQLLDTLKKRGVIPADYQPRQSRQVRKPDHGTSGSPTETSDPTLNTQYGRDIAKRMFGDKEQSTR